MTSQTRAPGFAGASNWPLGIGLALAAVVLTVAIAGPRLAPRDPLQETYTKLVGEEFVRPPFPPLRVEGYPLGTDEFGRDTLSRLLWAVRPTLTLVFVAAALRLVVGIGWGMLAGWGEGWGRRIADSAIAAALALPALFVALGVIAATGHRLGVWAFILGLSVTGWAETARLMRNQTRSLKDQPFVEAARAVGASRGEILYRHVLSHLLPLGWVLLAFEVSYTLLTTAALGFMGYFINSVWIDLDDGVAILASGLPELGQMLASASRSQHVPWVLALSGTAVFVSVLAFGLLGEGMRARLNPQLTTRRGRSWLGRVFIRLDDWLVDRLPDVIATWRRSGATVVAAVSLAAILLGGGYALWRMQAAPVAAVSRLPVPGGHGWASARHDAYGTRWSEVEGPSSPLEVWRVEQEDVFVGGPAVAADGSLYVASFSGALHAYSSDGIERWKTELGMAPLSGVPALDESGHVYAVDAGGGLTALEPTGVMRWNLEGDGSDLLDGPLVAPGGTLYYATQNNLRAVTPAGEVVWQVPLPTYSLLSGALRLSPDAQYLFFEDTAVDTTSGATVYGPTQEPFDGFVVTAEARVFLRSPSEWLEWEPTDTGAVLVPWTRVDSLSLEIGGTPGDGGGTPDGIEWSVFSGFRGSFPSIVWLDAQGQVRGTSHLPYASGQVVGVDKATQLYVCGLYVEEAAGGFQIASLRGNAQCSALEPGSSRQVWALNFENSAPVIGGALAEGRLYVVTANGVLYALGDGG